LIEVFLSGGDKGDQRFAFTGLGLWYNWQITYRDKTDTVGKASQKARTHLVLYR